MASKMKRELEVVKEHIDGMRYVSKLIDAIQECINTTVADMIDNEDVKCDNEALIEMALEEIVYGTKYSGKDVEDRIKQYAEGEEE